MHVHLIGPFPPPYGGVSVHIRRLRSRLQRSGHECTVWCQEDRPEEVGVRALGRLDQAVRRLGCLPKDAILHFHQHYLLAGLFAHRRCVFTAHNERINSVLAGGRFPGQWSYRAASRSVFRRMRHVIAVSEGTRTALVDFGIPDARIRVINAYLPPEPDEQAHIDNLMALKDFRRRFKYLATANAWALSFFRDQDLYGIDLCIQMLGRLRNQCPHLGLVLALPLARGTPYLAKMQELAECLGVSERILWLLEPGAYHPILYQCDLFLRPTNTDGFCISIAEAFEGGVPVIASDAVARPPGCVVFRSRDLSDFVMKTSQVILHSSIRCQLSDKCSVSDRFSEIFDAYTCLANE